MTKNISEELQRTARQALTGLHPVRQGEETGGLPFRRLLCAVFRARYLVFGTTLLGLLVGTFLAITTANTYVSTGKFVFTGGGAESTQVDLTRATVTSQETIGTAATYVLGTDDLLRRVVDRVTPARILAAYQPANPDASALKAFFFKIQRDWNATRAEDLTPEEALKHLRKSIVIDRPRQTDVLVTQCSANDPFLAREILDAYLEEAPKWHIEKYEDKAAYDAAEAAAVDAHSAAEVAAGNMAKFLKGNQLTDFEAEKKRLLLAEADSASRLAKANDDLEIQKDLFAVLTKRVEGEGALKQYNTEMRKIDITSASLERLGKELAEAETTRINLLREKADPNHPSISQADEYIRKLSERMKHLNREAIDAELVPMQVENQAYAEATRRRSAASLEITLLESHGAIAREIDRVAKTNLKALLDLEPEFIRLSNALLFAADNLKGAQGTWHAAQQKHALGQGHFSSLKPIEEASLPLEKESPNRSKTILGATLVGLFLGLGLILLTSLPDNVVRTRDDLEGMEGLANIGVLPRLDSRNLKRHSFLRKQGW